MGIYHEIERMFADHGDEMYGEDVTQRQHGLQAAYFAGRDGAPEELVVAALLHDIGHMIDASPEDIARQGVDTLHEDVGHLWLADRFPSVVSECARLHVEAKRYLCATDPGYMDKLSEASRLSLKLQGGPMSPEEVREFEAGPFAREAAQLRVWDDLAKEVDLEVPALEHYREAIERVAHASAVL